MNANLRNFALWVIIVLLLLALFTLFQNPGTRPNSQDISYSELLNEVDNHHVRDVVIQGQEIRGTFNSDTPGARGGTFTTYAPPNDPNLINTRLDKILKVTPEDVERVATKYLTAANRSVIITVPKTASPKGGVQ